MAEVLVVGLSARALAQSARAGGYVPFAADLFCDLDLCDAAERNVRIAGDLDRGLAWPELSAALEELAAGRAPIGIVCGAGFEDRPELIARISERWRVLGNSADAVARIKDPAHLAELCNGCGIPHPRWSETPSGEGWLPKRRGGSGGAHVGTDGGEVRYWQEHVEGEAVSALVLSDGSRAMVLGLSAQWIDPSPTAPFRYGGAARPADLDESTTAGLADAATRIVEAAGLIGLNSVDFLVDRDRWHLIEINPRPGATLDIFRPVNSSSFALHVEACGGKLPSDVPRFSSVAAAARTVYARHDVACVSEFDWPAWAADRQPPGSAVRKGAPLCTVTAEAASAAEARRLVDERGDAVAASLGAA